MEVEMEVKLEIKMEIEMKVKMKVEMYAPILQPNQTGAQSAPVYIDGTVAILAQGGGESLEAQLSQQSL